MTWYSVDRKNNTITTDHLHYQYGFGYLHNGDGTSITQFIDPRTGENTAYGFDGQYLGTAWDGEPAQILDVQAHADYVDIHVQTGQTDKIDRVYKNRALLEITYQRNTADWTEDFIKVNGEEVTFVMHGLADVVGLAAGKALWDKSEALCGHNYGECFIQAAGGTVEGCLYKGHFIYGYLNRQTGHGTGFVYPTWITTHEWKVWWTESHKIEIEYAPHGNTGKRCIFAVVNGREEVLAVGKQWVDENPV